MGVLKSGEKERGGGKKRQGGAEVTRPFECKDK